MDRELFLRPETRADFLVDEDRKRLWLCLLDMLECVASICDKYGLTYYLGGGTLLGAIRHGGIIPWDDDIDIHLMRADYDRLQEILPKELPAHYFMQNSATDPEYTITHVKIRDARYSAIPMYHVREHAVYNMGAFLDIFPLDGRAPTEKQRNRQLRDLKWMKAFHKFAVMRKPRNIKQRVAAMFCRAIYRVIGANRFYRWRERVTARYGTDQEVLNLAIAEFGFRDWKKRIWLERTKKVPFEYLTCIVPEQSEETLTAQFGDWHQFVKGTGLHGEMVFDQHKDFKTKLIEECGYLNMDFQNKPY